ncbi:alpha-ketoglutarate-dependent dioxygenase AlkB family protein [Pseudoponticoccus marisrubri]|uniref:Alkylated DNA repair dioxygenase n=1 Tax=Pseudoponticoccus marisrubri TaxID=1685382 RepID=A0A0W7WJG4_9RHOB|nr:alpha-ketoglutarate-dependent dioxygenase AlkB [Pseudoponticoccus marisrubri]KUF10671.1 alkylated DNA repair dioxygenase [Pseudoponticoccus marisrubri]
MTPIERKGFVIHPEFLNRAAQEALVARLREILRAAPLVQPVTPRGRPMSVRMSAAGDFGWITDRRGYRYEPRHPEGMAWPEIPSEVRAIWDAVSGCDRAPECCLINWYGEGARMGMHQDHDEADLSCPVVSVSLGDEALFRMGNVARGGRTETVWLRSGDVVVMGGDARLAHHGVDRIRFGSSTLLPQGGRINLTLRVVTAPAGR